MKQAWIVVIGVLFCTGCGVSKVSETESPLYRQGLVLLQSDKPKEALPLFLEVIKKVPDAKNAYLNIGQIYLSAYDDPVLAIYFLRAFLARDPSKHEEQIAKGLIESSKNRLVQQVLGPKKVLYESHQQFLTLLQHLRDENQRLKTQLKNLHKIQ